MTPNTSRLPDALDDVLERWRSRDDACALHLADRRALEQTESLRRAVVAFVLEGDFHGDVFGLCALLGHHWAVEGASPTLASMTLGNLRDTLAQSPPWLPRAQAALLETYVAARLDAHRQEWLPLFESPACVVPLGPGCAAIAANFPASDGEDLSRWADHVARDLAKQGVRQVHLSGNPAALEAIRASLALVAIRELAPKPLPWLARLLSKV